MGQPAEVEKENSERGIFLSSEIDAAAYDRIAPIAVGLRLKSKAPICLFINSLGGNPWVAEQILRLIRSPRQDGERCMVTTVCIGTAGSAAADLLCAGDYAIAYRDSMIHVHGTRETHSELTIEKLHEVEEILREDNEYFAMKLASKMFRRFATQALLFEAFKTSPPNNSIFAVNADPGQILQTIRDNVSEEHRTLVDDAHNRMDRVRQLSEYIQLNAGDGKYNSLEGDIKLLKTIVDFEHSQLLAKQKPGESLGRLPPEMLDLIQSDFIHFKEILDGTYMEQTHELCRQKGHYFLSAAEMTELRSIPSKETEKRKQFLEQKSSQKVFPLWYLVVSLCRLLQQGEHSFTASEAWYFGLIDEVTGSNLPSLRKWKQLRITLQALPSQVITLPASSQRQPTLPPASSTLPPPPAAQSPPAA